MTEIERVEPPKIRTRHESEIEVLKAMSYARRLLEQACTYLAGCTEELALKHGQTNNSIKLIRRGWEKADDYIGREISDGAMSEFLFRIEQIREEELKQREMAAKLCGPTGEESGGGSGADGEARGGAQPDGPDRDPSLNEGGTVFGETTGRAPVAPERESEG